MRANNLIQGSVLAVFLVTTLVVSRPAGASPIVFSAVDGNLGHNLLQDLTGLDSAGFTAGSVLGSFAAHARAAVGDLGVDALLSLVGGEAGVGGSVQSFAMFQDTVTISSSVIRDGTPGSISFAVSIDGGFAGSPPPADRGEMHVSWLYGLAAFDETFSTVLGDYRVGDSLDLSASSESTLTTGVFGSTGPLGFVFGQPFELEGTFDIELAGDVAGPFFSFASLSFLHSADLQGIASVTDGAGNLVLDYTINADSGADYTQPFGGAASATVPEPSSLVLLVSGMCGLLAMARKRAGLRIPRGAVMGVIACTALFVARPVLASPVLFTEGAGFLGLAHQDQEGTDSAGFLGGGACGSYAAHGRAAVGDLGVDGLLSLIGAADRSCGILTGGAEGAAEAGALFSDTLTIFAPGVPIGTPGRISFAVNIDGGFSASAPSVAGDYIQIEWIYELETSNPDHTVDGFYAASDAIELRAGDHPSLTTGVFGTSDPLEFLFGLPFTLQGTFSVRLSGFVLPGDFTFGSLSFLHSADLRGIASVTDDVGNTVLDYTISADSGADYTQPFGGAASATVPEPSSLVLLVSGMCGLLAMARKRAWHAVC